MITPEEILELNELNATLCTLRRALKYERDLETRADLKSQLDSARSRYHELQPRYIAYKRELTRKNIINAAVPQAKEILLSELDPESPEIKNLVWAHPHFIRLQLLEIAVHEVLSSQSKLLLKEKIAELQHRLRMGEQILNKERPHND